MKIGIMTFWWSNDNYGQLLQCYAMQKYLRDLGHDAFLIRYNYKTDVKKNPLLIRCLKAFNPVLLARYILIKKHVADVRSEQLKNDRGFDEFRARYIAQSERVYRSYFDLKANSPEADAYIVGSDQVWNYWHKNPRRYFNPNRAYFLDFGSENARRLSYAASWGVTELPEDYEEEIKPLLAGFEYVSVREESGVELCRECGRNDAEWVCDPTLLLSAEIYRSLYSENRIRKPDGKYILLYMLDNECDFDVQSVYAFAEARGLKVIYVTGNGVIDGREKFFATIPEWLCLIDNAEYVITNSFHGSVFCTVFHKPFGVVRLTGKEASMNARFESLFDLRGTGNRYLSGTDFSVLDKDYELKSIVASEKFLEALK